MERYPTIVRNTFLRSSMHFGGWKPSLDLTARSEHRVLYVPVRRRLRQQPELGHQPHLVEIEVDLRELAALESRNHGDRKSDGLVCCGDRRAPRHVQRSRVGCSHVAQLRNPIPSAELLFRHQPDVRERLEERLEARPDRLRSLDRLGMLWIPLDDRIQMQAFEPVQVAVVQGLRRRVDHLEILFYAHRFTSSFPKALGILNAPLLGPHPDSASMFDRITLASFLRTLGSRCIPLADLSGGLSPFFPPPPLRAPPCPWDASPPNSPRAHDGS